MTGRRDRQCKSFGVGSRLESSKNSEKAKVAYEEIRELLGVQFTRP